MMLDVDDKDTKIKVSTISYFDVNQKNGGAIFAKNLDTFLNTSNSFLSSIYCNIKKGYSEKVEALENRTSIGISAKLKQWVLKNNLFELTIYFLRNDLNALKLLIGLRLKKQIDDNSILLFHDHLTLFYAGLFFNLSKRKVVLIMHNDGNPIDMITLGIQTVWKRKLLSNYLAYQMTKVVRHVDKAVFLCDKAKHRFLNAYQLSNEKAISIPNGIKPLDGVNFSERKGNRIKFITVCTLNERKGIDLLIEAIPIINNTFEEKIEFVVVGDGPLITELYALSRLHLNLNVMGESSQVAELLAESDVFFLLSRNEGQPLSILEALRASLIVLTTDVGCSSSMVNDSNGILVNPNVQEIVDGVTALVINWDMYEQKRINSKKIFNELFQEQKMYNSYKKLFSSL
ncbi:MAG: glycosyltransferase family 4 protein [Pedobacter sp.]|uniref:glycosyltransferase family 4 protein n=1 Tax=Pedobacter sp. TaxID=1411316 RepID=UPI0028071B76|nr:glycosyltransferase family 4 protein [Pedobacter sp.]MDQ8004317.1 glycosyltransferase family 4 protein [Pedobacter sp.]